MTLTPLLASILLVFCGACLGFMGGYSWAKFVYKEYINTTTTKEMLESIDKKNDEQIQKNLNKKDDYR